MPYKDPADKREAGEVLYCNWRDCPHDRALLPGEGVRWFKGRVHMDCFLTMQREGD